MPISLTLDEKKYLVALYGDIPYEARVRLFRIGTFPAQTGPYVMQGGYDFRAELDDGRVIYPKRPRRRHPSLRRVIG